MFFLPGFNLFYAIQIYSYDYNDNGGRVSSWSFTTGTGSGTSYTIPSSSGSPNYAPTSSPFFTLTGVSNGSGDLTFQGVNVSGSADSVFVNGFTVTPVPEPATVVPVLATTACLAGYRSLRRRFRRSREGNARAQTSS